MSTDNSIDLDFTVAGTFRGKAVHAKVTPSALTCLPTGVGGSSVLLQWGGYAAGRPTFLVSGDMNGGVGTHTFDPNGSDATATLVLDDDFSHRLLWTGGSYTLDADRKSGTVDLDFGTAPDNDVHLEGSFVCSS